MKSLFKTLFLMMLLASTSIVSAQDADDVIKDYLKASGGADKMAAITTLKLVGESTSPQGTAPMTILKKAPLMSKTVINVMGSEMIFAYDGATGWSSNPWQEGGKPKKMDEAQSKRFTEDEMEDPFINYADKGHSVKLLGEEDIDDETHYKVRLTKKGGAEIIYYFNADTGLPTQTKMLMTEGRAKGSIMVTTFGDYKKVDGFMMPHTRESMVDGTSTGKIVFSEMMINQEIADSEFAFPATEEEKK